MIQARCSFLFQRARLTGKRLSDNTLEWYYSLVRLYILSILVPYWRYNQAVLARLDHRILQTYHM